MPTASFRKNYDLIKIDDALGLVYGWGAIYTEGGEEYFDTQGDAIDPDGMQAAALDFMEHSRVAGDLHEKNGGTIPFMLPISEDVAKALELETSRTGLAMAMRPNDEVLEKFRTGEYTGFSIGGTRIDETVVDKGYAKRGDKKYQQGKRRREKRHDN